MVLFNCINKKPVKPWESRSRLRWRASKIKHPPQIFASPRDFLSKKKIFNSVQKEIRLRSTLDVLFWMLSLPPSISSRVLVLLFYIFEKIFGQKNIRESEIKNGRGSEENKQIFWKNIQFCSLKMYTRYSSKRFGAFSFPKDLKLTELNAEWHLRVSQYETQQRREATWCMMNNVKLLQRWEGFEVWIEAGISCGMSKQERKIWEKKYASKREKKCIWGRETKQIFCWKGSSPKPFLAILEQIGG